jgi:hypothetical protein
VKDVFLQRLGVRTWSPMARAVVTVRGEVTSETVAEARALVLGAQRAGYRVSVDVSQVERITPGLLDCGFLR